MSSYEQALTELQAATTWSYGSGSQSSTEPAALCALALLGADRAEAAQPIIDWLVQRQAADGSVPVDETPDSPRWTTGLAILAFQHWSRLTGDQRLSLNIERAISWSLKSEGTVIPPDQAEAIGHNTMLIGWPWVIGTHSWIEPTAIFTLALRSVGLSDHFRVIQATRLLVDRQLPQGGCNYGNTSILGQTLRPHVQPTGWTMLALNGQVAGDSIAKSLAYLRRALASRLSVTSRAFAMLGIEAHAAATDGARGPQHLELLNRSLQQSAFRTSVYHRSLFVHAYQGKESLLIAGR